MSGSAFADAGQVAIGPVPQWVTASDPMPVPAGAGGAAFLRRQDVLVHLDEQGQQDYMGYRVRILQPNALELGNIAITWNPAAGAPVVHAIRIYRDGAVIDVLKTANFEVLRREDQLEAARLDGMLTAVLRVGDLRVGDELEVSYTTRIKDPTLGNLDSGSLFVGASPSPGRYHIGLSWDEGAKPNLKMTPDMTLLAQTSERAVDFRLDNPRPANPPKDAPLRFQWQRIVEFSDFADWTTVSQRMAPLFAETARLSANSPLKQEARRIMAANPTPMGRASAALKLVQQNVRYVYVGLDRGNLTPAGADETWQRRYGDCKAKTVLLLALLGEMGIEAEPVLVNNNGFDDGLDQRLPGPRMFDHVLVRARIGGVAYWLDGTLPAVAGPGTEPAVPYRWVLPLSAKGSALEHIPWHPAKRPDLVSTTEIDARQGFVQPAHVVSTMVLRGIKGLQQQMQFAPVPPDQLLNAFRQNLVGGQWQTVEDVQWHYDEAAQASVLTVTGTWKIDWEDDGKGARSLALPGGGFSPPDRRGRASDQNQDLPYYNPPSYNCYATTVRLPLDTRSRQWSSKPGYDVHMFGQNYYRAFALRDGAIRMIRGFRVEQTEIDAATARKDNDRIAGFDNSMGYIFFNSQGQATPIPAAPNVPATYDIDWTADNVPCLSVAALEKNG